MLVSRATLVRNQRSVPTARLAALAMTVFGATWACGAPASDQAKRATAAPATNAEPTGKRVDFAFEDLDGQPVSSETVKGRVTVIALIATYDVASQASARWLGEIVKDHVPRINGVGIDLELPENKPLASAFAGALHLPYPLCMADDVTIRGEGAFAGLGQVPSLVILDKTGVERFRHVGLLKKEELEAAVKRVESGKN